MQIRVRLLEQAAEGQARQDLGRRGDRDADQVGGLRQDVRHQSGPEDLQVRILLLVRDRLQDVVGRIDGIPPLVVYLADTWREMERRKEGEPAIDEEEALSVFV